MWKFFSKKPGKTEDYHKLDTDKDGLLDHEEINVYGTNPLDPDTDKDGVPDGLEVRLGRNPLGPGPLRDLFIPSASNNYKPQILNPRRLVFHSVAAIAVKLIVVGLVVFYPLTAWLTPDILTAESKKIISLTNNLRSKVGVGSLSENSSLNQAAYYKAQDMLINQYFAHVGPDRKDLSDWLEKVGYKYAVAGENLAMGFANAEDVVNAWTKSPTHYANLVDTDFKEIGVGMVSGPYNDYDTTLVAQYFGFSYVNNTASAPAVVPAPTPTPAPTPPVEIVEPEPVVQPEPAPQPQAPAEQNTQPPAPEPIPVTEPAPTTPQAEPKPAPSPQPQAEPKPDPKPIVQNQPVNTTQNQAPTPQPKPQPQGEPAENKVDLPVPELVYPQKDFLFNQDKVNVVVYAPNAEKVVALREGIEIGIGSKPYGDNNYIDVLVTLEDGKQDIVFQAIAGTQTIQTEPITFELDISAPAIDHDKSRLIVLEPDGKKEVIVKAVVYVSEDTKHAEVIFESYRVELEPSDPSDETAPWIGQIVIFGNDQDEVFDTVTLPVLSITDSAGNKSNTDIEWENVIPVKPSLLKQYFFAKSHPLKSMSLLFEISSVYYAVILVSAILALLLNIFIEIKRQHPKTIASSLGFVVLLLILIIV